MDKVSLESTNWLKSLIGDWCSRNTYASDLHSERISLVPPSIPWTSYAANGTIKHMLKSEPISLSEVIKFIPYLHTILHYFQFSGESLAIFWKFGDEPENSGYDDFLFYYKDLI